MNYCIKVSRVIGSCFRIVKPPPKKIKQGDTITLTNIDDSVEHYLVVDKPCTNCSLYEGNRCLRWQRYDNRYSCLLTHLSRNTKGNLSFVDISAALEDL